MTLVTRFVSSALLATGMILVFAGLSAALGFNPMGMAASLAAIVTLLYAGGTWFGAPTPRQRREPVIVFDRTLRVACGSASGASVAAQFPESRRGEIEAACAAALTGQSIHFTCEQEGAILGFDAAPVRAADGTVVYGILISGTAAPASAAAAYLARQLP